MYINCYRNVAKLFAVCVNDYTREVIKETKEITFKLCNTYSAIYGVLLVLAPILLIEITLYSDTKILMKIKTLIKDPKTLIHKLMSFFHFLKERRHVWLTFKSQSSMKSLSFVWKGALEPLMNVCTKVKISKESR